MDPSKNEAGKKYLRRPVGLRNGKMDVYSVSETFGITCPAIDQAVKKLLFAGRRGYKDALQDLSEAKDALLRAYELAEERLRLSEMPVEDDEDDEENEDDYGDQDPIGKRFAPR